MAQIDRQIWARQAFDGRNVIVSIDTRGGKDAALARLVEVYPFTEKTDWDYLASVDPEQHHIGGLGQHIPL